MREIKFRAWNVATKTMVDLRKITPLALNMDTDGLFIPFSDGLHIMQYTGLKDKNGVEIYEGDIVEWGFDNQNMGEIIFYQDAYHIKSKGIFAWHLHDALNYNLKIIGNIYENPELVKTHP